MKLEHLTEPVGVTNIKQRVGERSGMLLSCSGLVMHDDSEDDGNGRITLVCETFCYLSCFVTGMSRGDCFV